jgi:hypothetical protein
MTLLLYPWEGDLVPIVQEAGWASGPVWTGTESSLQSGFEPQAVQSVASFYTAQKVIPAVIVMIVTAAVVHVETLV